MRARIECALRSRATEITASPRPISILIVVGSLDRGGTERHLLQVLPALDRCRFAPSVFALVDRGQLADEMESYGVPVVAPWVRGGISTNLIYGLFRMALVTLQLWLHMLVNRPRIAHFFLPASYLIGLPAALLAGIPVRLMSRRSRNHYQQKHPFAGRLERWWHHGATAVVANSARVLDDLTGLEGVPAERAALIYNGVPEWSEETASRAEVRAQLNANSKTLVLVIVANLIPYKGHKDLLDACAAAAPALGAGWALWMAGRDDGIGASLDAHAQTLGIADHVKRLGERSDTSDLLAAADLFVLASHEEGFSNALLEAMAASLPCVATDVGGNAEAIANGISGLIVPPQDPEKMSHAIVRLAQDATLRRRFAQNARADVEQKFSVDACLAAYEQLYEALARNLPLPAALRATEPASGQPR
ncbi:MAG: glycosyltransferase [Pseudomonadota bacterium]